MNILILTPDRVGSTLLQRLAAVYASINQSDPVTVNLHELTNGLVRYHNEKYGIPMLGKKSDAWGYHQSLKEVVELLKSVDHGVSSRLAHYHIKNRKDKLSDQLSFYEYLNNNFFIIATRRRNVFEHAISWGITVESKKLNVYQFEEKYETYKTIYDKGINIDQHTLEKYLTQYDEYMQWVDSHFNVNAYFYYEDHLLNIEQFILNLNAFKQQNYTVTWEDKFGISWNDWNKVHYLLSLVPFNQKFTQEENDFIKSNIAVYTQVRSYIQDIQDDGLLVGGIPIKLQTMSEKAKIIHNLEYCLDTYNNWITHNNPAYAIGYQPAEIADIAGLELANWKLGSVDTNSLLSYTDIDETTLLISDLKL